MAPSSTPWFLATFVLLLNLVAAQSGCFWANGTENPSLDYSPCTGSGLTSICCSIRDVCLDNGLCHANTGYFWRETCTSSNWDTGACQDLCAYNSTQKATDQVVTPCDGTANSTIWCCGDSDACCAQDSTVPRYTIAQKFAASAATTASSSSSSVVPSSSFSSIVVSTTSSTSSANSAIATGDLAPNSNSGLSTGAKAGIGVGAAIGALALIGLGVFIARALQWRRKLRAKEGGAGGDSPSHVSETYGSPLYQAGGSPVMELEHPVAEKPTIEIYGRQVPGVQELSASNEK